MERTGCCACAGDVMERRRGGDHYSEQAVRLEGQVCMGPCDVMDHVFFVRGAMKGYITRVRVG